MTLSDQVKNRDLNDNQRNYSQEDLMTVGMLDMSLFFFIFIELLVAFLVFALLSKKFGIKFDIKQVLIHIIVILSVSVSRVTGFVSEAISVNLAHLYSK